MKNLKMKSQALFVAFVVFAICAKGNAQIPPSGSDAIGPQSYCVIYLVILQTEAAKISSSFDLYIRTQAVLHNTSAGCAECDGFWDGWLYKVCLVINVRSGLNQLWQIKAETIARENATTTTRQIPIY